MKKTVLSLVLLFLSLSLAWSQCVPTCSNYVISSIPFTPFPSAGTNAIPMFIPNTDDGYTPPVQLGFNFNFYCTTYSTVLIYTNGLLQFDIGAPSTFPLGYDPAQLLPNPSLPTVLNGIVCFKMDDLDPGVGGSITYTTLGIAPNRKFVLTYSSVPVYTATPPASLLNSGQIVLYETSNIIEIYTINAALSLNAVTQGIENAAGTLGIATPGRNQTYWSGSSDAFRFEPVGPAPPTGLNGNTLVCQATQNTYSINTSIGTTSYSWSLPGGWGGGSSVTTAITGTAGVSGTVSVTATYTCGISAPATLSITVLPAPVISVLSVNPPGFVCSGNNFTITPAGGFSYTISPGGTVSNTEFIINASTVNSFTITGSSATCPALNSATATIQINQTPTVSVNSGSICLGKQFSITPTGVGADSYNVSGGFFIVTPIAAGVYNFTVTGSTLLGCNSTPVISTLIVNPNPTVTATSSRSLICKGEAEKLTASGAATYSWNVGGALTNTVVVTPSTTAQYAVTGTSAEGCSVVKTINIIVVVCTGIGEENVPNQKCSVFPNPSNGTFKLQLPTANINTNIEIYDAVGNLVLSQKTDRADNNLNLTNQPNGLYYVKIKNQEGQQTLKIIKE